MSHRSFLQELCYLPDTFPSNNPEPVNLIPDGFPGIGYGITHYMLPERIETRIVIQIRGANNVATHIHVCSKRVRNMINSGFPLVLPRA